jgi:hypothetical protein
METQYFNEAQFICWITGEEQSSKGAQSKQKRPVEQLTMDGVLVDEFPGTAEAAAAVGASQSAISHCVNGRKNTTKGYLWRYKDLDDIEN